ncbi:permease [Escherichia coli]|nr:permease [Escherichia coli]EHK7495379.1 permease [Escherichia coli]
MKTLFRLKTWLVKVFAPDKKTLIAIGDDLRKVGVTSISVGIVGVIVTGDTITSDEALSVVLLGVILWLTGVVLTGVGNREDS